MGGPVPVTFPLRFQGFPQLRAGGTIDPEVIAAGTIGTTALADESVTLAKMADLATDTVVGRTTAGTGVPEALTPAQLRQMMSVGQLARTDYTPVGSTSTTTTSITLVAVDATNLSVTFVAPDSGKVKVTLEAMSSRAAALTATVWGVIDDAGTPNVMLDNLSCNVVTTTLVAHMRSGQVTGLTPGQSYTWRFAHRAQAAGTALTNYGPHNTASITIDAVP